MSKGHKICAIVPLKTNSTRLPNKNFLPLAGKPLFMHILESLHNVEEIDGIYLYTSDLSCIDYLPDFVTPLIRPQRLDGDNILANELFEYAVTRVESEYIVLCQAPAPFVSSKTIKSGIQAVTEGAYDSAMAVRRIQTFCWHEGSPVNYNPEQISQTQNLSPVYEETSGLYVFKRSDYLKSGTRVNGRVKFLEVDYKEAIDIDNPEDFLVAHHMSTYKSNPDDFLENLRNEFSVLNTMRLVESNKELKNIVIPFEGIIVDDGIIKLAYLDWQAQLENKDAKSFDYQKYSSLLICNPSIINGIKVLLKNHYSLTVTSHYPEDLLITFLDNNGISTDNIAIISIFNVNHTNKNDEVNEVAFGYLKSMVQQNVLPDSSIVLVTSDLEIMAAEKVSLRFAHIGMPKKDSPATIWFGNFDDFVDYLV